MAKNSPIQPNESNGIRDLFLSYNSRDRAVVLRVSKLLARRNIDTFFDRDQLSAGSRWVSLLEGEVGCSRAVAVFIGPHGLGDWQEMEMQLALVRQIDEKKAGRTFPIIPLILPGANPQKELGFLKLYTWVDLRSGVDDSKAIDELERAVRGDVSARLAEAAVELCPYRALRAFREQDANLFFGRDPFAEQLLEKARDEKLKLIAVVGPSGCGKSSIVQAGLLPLLRSEQSPYKSWETAILIPGKAPFHNLAEALVTVNISERDKWERLGKAEKLGQDLAEGTIRLEAAMTTALADATGTKRLLLVIDQAEELFTLIKENEEHFKLITEQGKEKIPLPPESDGKLFIQRLIAATKVTPVTILLTLRADFYGQAISHSRELGELIVEGQVTILPMSSDELRQIIVAPAESSNLRFEAGLVDLIIGHIENQPGSLPMLEFALTELWGRRQNKLLSIAGYKEIGGVEGAISQRAEEQFNRLSRDEQETAQRVLTRLVHVAAAAEEGTDTRQRVRLNELDTSEQKVARTFVEARLLVTSRIEINNEQIDFGDSQEIIEVAHEALIRNWQRLKELLNRDRQFLLWRQRLGIAIVEWQRTGRDAGALLRGAPLNEARRWRKERGHDLNKREQEFIACGESAERQPKFWIVAATALLTVIALTAFGWKLWDNSPHSQINKILLESSSVVKTTAANHLSIEYVSAIVYWITTLSLTDRSNVAVETALKIEDPDFRAKWMGYIVYELAKVGKMEDALEITRKIEKADDRASALGSVIVALAKAGKTEEMGLVAAEALDALRKIEKADDRAGALDSVVDALAKAGKTEEIGQAAAEALDVIRKIEKADDRASALSSVIVALAKAGKTEEMEQAVAEALDALSKIEDPDAFAHPLLRVVEALAKVGKMEETLEIARQIEDPTIRDQVLGRVVEARAEVGKPEEALEIARRIKMAVYRVQALGSVIEALAKTGKTKEMEQAVAEDIIAISIVNNTDDHSQDRALGNVTRLLVKSGKTEDALEAVRKVTEATNDLFVYNLELNIIVGALAKAGKPKEALEIAWQIEDPAIRDQALGRVVEPLAKAGKPEEALEIARKIEDPATRAQALAGTVEMLAIGLETADKARNVIVEAQQVAEKISREYEKSQTLPYIARGLAKLHLYRQARELVDVNYIQAADKLQAYRSILREYYIEHHPEQKRVFDLWQKQAED